MILSQITRSDVRFELLLCTSDAESLSPVVASVASVAQTVAVVGPGTITVVAVVGISISLWLGGGLSISGPLAVVVSMMSVRVSVSVCSVAKTVVSQSIGSVVVGISIGLWLSISGPLAVVGIRVSSMVSGISVVETRVGVRVGTITIGAVEEGRVSLSLRLGLWLTGDEGGKANHKSELHCCLSVQSRIPM